MIVCKDVAAATVDLYKKYLKKACNLLMPVMLVVYSLLLVNQGITVTDTGYNYGNFVNFDSLDGMWKFSTYLANATGMFFAHLPGGQTMLGLNLYTGLVKALIALVTYFVCVRVFEIPWKIAFLAELMALGYCWCPTALLYNYITYLLFTLGAMFLCVAVKTEKDYWYIPAGVCLGLNVMVRLPNLAEMALILAVWFICFVQKVKLPRVLKKTGCCILGYLAGVCVVLAYIVVRYGLSAYVEGIRQLLAMPSEAGGYSLKAMIRGDVYLYLVNMKWVFIALGVVAVGVIMYAIKRQRYMPAKRVLYILCNLFLILIYRKMHMFDFVYYAYDGVYTVGTLFLIMAGLMGLYVMFFGGKDYVLRMHAATMGIVILITPLGSNNWLFTAVNNLFWVTPFVLHCCYKWVLSARNGGGKKTEYFLEPLRITYLFLVAFVLVQGVLFGATFVFRDGIDGEKRTEKIVEIPVLKGMYTQVQNAENLNSLYTYLEEEGLVGKEAIFYYNVPGLSFYMDLKPALSSTWPDLDSFVVDKLERELKVLETECRAGREKPLLIMGCDLELDAPKINILREYAEGLEYELVFENEMCKVYR